MFDFSKLMRDPGDFVDQALTVAGAYTSGAPAAETKDLELVMDVIGYCEPLQRFFGSRWF